MPSPGIATIGLVSPVSPVSRGRKSKKKSTKRGPTPPKSRAADVTMPSLAEVVQLLGQRTRPVWFDPALKSVLDGAAALDGAGRPRELEQLTVELLGAEMYAAHQESRGGLWFSWWFEELVAAAAARVVEEAAAGVGRSAFLLLNGLAAVGTPGLASMASAESRRVRKLLAGVGLPEWLDDLSRVAATGEVFRMRDAYGTRFAVLAGFSYGGVREPSVFLFDIDASRIIKLVGAGVFDDVDQAAAAWLAAVGDTAGEVIPQPVADPRELLCLVHCVVGDEMSIFGDETRVVMDNWFRASRRHRDLAEALRGRGMPLPAHESLYHDPDIDPMAEEFTSWYTGKHGARPDTEALRELAAEWLEGSIPETWYSISPERLSYHRKLLDDWVQDDPITLAVMALLPDWVAWLSERSGLPKHLYERVDALAH
jgi:hypothetical protein